MKTIIKKEIKDDKEIDVEFLQETIPAKIVEHKKDEYVADLEQRLAFYRSEEIRSREMADGLQTQLDSLK